MNTILQSYWILFNYNQSLIINLFYEYKENDFMKIIKQQLIKVKQSFKKLIN